VQEDFDNPESGGSLRFDMLDIVDGRCERSLRG
jgi:hypothetical protein